MPNQLTEHQKVLLQILCEFDRICRKHKINYILFAGSAIGAVRHRGFVPWDDDIDVALLRPDYERFLELAPAELDKEVFYLQGEFSDHWPLFFSKLRKNGTACMERLYPKDPQTHQGIYIDIFSVDPLADGRLMQKLQFAASKIVIAKALDRRGYLTDSKLKKIFMFCCRALPSKPFHRFVCRRKHQDSALVHTFLGGASKFSPNTFRREWFTERIEVPFEDGTYYISAHYDEMLRKIYGDYLRIPSEEERRCKVHGVIVDTEHSYENYLDAQRNMKITEYARSIR